jgi:hypothetical protein
VGEVENPGSGVDGFVVALAASSGDERWRLLYDGSKTYRRPEAALPPPSAADISPICVEGRRLATESPWNPARPFDAAARRE